MQIARWGRFGIAAAAVGVVVALSAPGGSASVTVSQSGWAWGNPSPQGNTLRAISFAGALGYAVGDNGTALKTLNGGASWAGLATGTSGELTRVQIINANTVVVGSANGCILRMSTDGGAVFTRIFTIAEESCTDQVQAFSFVSPTIGYLLLRNGSALATRDGGGTFSRLTAVPGTPSSSGGGANAGIDIHFTGPLSGIAFVGPSGGGQSSEYRTTDGGVSWVPVTLPSANVTAVHFVDSTHAFAIGPNTLLSTADGGATWTAQPSGHGNSFSSIDCTNPMTCVMTVAAGDHLVRTADGGATASITTPSSATILGAAYSSATRVVGVGTRGAIVASNDGGVNFTPGSSDIGGQYFRLRSGPAGLVYAPGTKGVLAISSNGGASWSTLATQTSADLRDVSFASSTTGYALDVNGGLQLTSNGGASWRTLDPGTSSPASAVAAVSENSVVLVGPVGVFRSVAGGRFNPVSGAAVSKAHLSDVNVAGAATFAFGASTLIVSTNGGAKWAALRLPLTGKRGKSPIRIRSVSFVNSSSGFLLDTQGRLWQTHNRGRTWAELLSTGASDGTGIAFSDAQHGFMTVGSFGADSSHAYVLHTSDGGSSWHPQLIATGGVLPAGLVAEGPSNAFALIDGHETVAGRPTVDLLFFTTSGGDAGGASTLGISTKSTRLSRKALRRRLHGNVRVDGVLAGAQGGEPIIVSRRNLAGGAWQHRVVIAGANGGSFTTTWHVTASSVFVAQWAGDSGRASLGSKVLRLTVR
jgi:photosystem II stability/assembly factor-like uncharacterized protein